MRFDKGKLAQIASRVQHISENAEKEGKKIMPVTLCIHFIFSPSCAARFRMLLLLLSFAAVNLLLFRHTFLLSFFRTLSVRCVCVLTVLCVASVIRFLSS